MLAGTARQMQTIEYTDVIRLLFHTLMIHFSHRYFTHALLYTSQFAPGAPSAELITLPRGFLNPQPLDPSGVHAGIWCRSSTVLGFPFFTPYFTDERDVWFGSWLASKVFHGSMLIISRSSFIGG